MKRRESETITSSKTISIRYLRVGKLFGVEDFLSPNPERKYSYSATVKSLSCKVLVFHRESALSKLKIHDYTWKLLCQYRVNKVQMIKSEQKTNEALNMIDRNLHQSDIKI